MDDLRRAQIRILVRVLERVQEEAHRVWLQEEEQFSKTANIPCDAATSLGNAAHSINEAINHMRTAVGDKREGVVELRLGPSSGLVPGRAVCFAMKRPELPHLRERSQHVLQCVALHRQIDCRLRHQPHALIVRHLAHSE
jgi:hypothetical protein